MMTPNKTNLAYDFSLFDTEDTEERVERKNKKRGETGSLTVIKSSVAKRGNMFRVMIIAVAAASIPFLIVNSQVALSELSFKIGRASKLYEEELAENARYQTELDNMVTLSKVEEYAAGELRLEKIKPSQEQHVELNTESLTEIAEEKESGLLSAAGGVLRDILEYLGF